MPVPFESGYDDQQLVRYLLELLPDEDRDRLDEASIADDELAARLRVVEDDLVDSYVSGTLTGDLRARFESRYLLSPRRREQVQFAGSFLHAVDRAAAAGADRRLESTVVTFAPKSAAASHEQPVKPTDRRAGRWSTPWLLFAAAAAVAILAVGALLVQTVRLRGGLTVGRNERVASDRRARELEQQLSDQRATNSAMAKEIERLRQSVDARSTTPRAADRSGAASIETAVALVLLPQTRAIGSIPTLTIPQDSSRVAVALQIESNDFQAYQVTLQDPASGQVVWRSNWIAAASRDGTPKLTLFLSARVLRPQHYSLAVTGRTANDGTQVVGSYIFQAVRP
jgi:hypothetical protein